MVLSEMSVSSKRCTDEFKIEAARQATAQGFKVAEVTVRLGVTTHTCTRWLRTSGKSGVAQHFELDQSAEEQRLKTELRRVTEERDILKKAAA
jgi:transposase